QRTLYGSLTLIFWMAWGYLWTPLLTFAAWAFGLTKSYEHMVTLQGYRGLLHLFGVYLLVIVVMGGSLLVWAFYNYFRFRGIERRRQRPAVDPVMLGEHYHLDPALLAKWQNCRRLVVHHDDFSNVTGVETDEGAWFRKAPLPGHPVAKSALQYIPRRRLGRLPLKRRA
ncbi:MAG: poly-beta-1,6-N-acetyl-D-glucosamine biosynthesis protein PgaD, partial [Betaproteobacteria bacterium]|nr:poly-beta-1,6-N-acetyl-D-glucosamine biosynthesis protein PgaD [Betaproteobacteria bacterium]